MKKKITSIGLGAMLALVLIGSSFAAVVGTNGSFETGPAVPASPGFVVLGAGDTSVTGWEVGSGTVDYINGYWVASDGVASFDLTGSSGAAGSVFQTLTTVVGATYTVTFDLSGNPAGPPALKLGTVQATGAPSQPLSYDVAVNSNTLGNMKWEPQLYSFMATSSSTILTFTSTTSGYFGPALDNVVVTETVPTAVNCKKGGWESMIDSAGNTFKNQGDCVSFFATDGKNLGAGTP